MGRHHYVPLRHRHDIPIRRREDVSLRRCWMFHLRLTCDIAETYKETPCRRVGNFMRENFYEKHEFRKFFKFDAWHSTFQKE